MVDGDIDGYYEIVRLGLTTIDGNPALRFRLGTYHSIGENWIQIYRTKMQPGELISLETVMDIYKK